MRLIHKDIERFIQQSAYSEGVKKKNTKYLLHFADYLGLRLDQPPDQVNLERIYEFKELSGMILYGPIQAEIIDEFFSSIHDYNPFYLKETRHALGSFFRYLQRNYKFPNPIPFLSFQIQSKMPHIRPNRSLSKHEVLRLLHAIISHSKDLDRDLLLFTLLLSSGCRIREIIELKVSNFEFSHHIFKITKAKNKRQRVGFLVDGMSEAIQRYCRRHQLAEADYLFKLDTAHPLTYKRAQELLQKYEQLANIPHITLHGTRHTFTTMMNESGCDITTIQQMLGHQPNQLDVTKRYIDQNVIKNKGIRVLENEELIFFLKSTFMK
ncbi:tyrosine-type recombinase/integrase [Paenibacillus sp. MAH-36]|nr:tyrosine-type recombinase/integrase [Paenibacillus sp. PFR10]